MKQIVEADPFIEYEPRRGLKLIFHTYLKNYIYQRKLMAFDHGAGHLRGNNKTAIRTMCFQTDQFNYSTKKPYKATA